MIGAGAFPFTDICGTRTNSGPRSLRILMFPVQYRLLPKFRGVLRTMSFVESSRSSQNVNKRAVNDTVPLKMLMSSNNFTPGACSSYRQRYTSISIQSTCFTLSKDKAVKPIIARNWRIVKLSTVLALTTQINKCDDAFFQASGEIIEATGA